MLLAFIYDEGIQNATGSGTKKKKTMKHALLRFTRITTAVHPCCSEYLYIYMYIFYIIIPSKLFRSSPSHCTSCADNDIARCCSYSLIIIIIIICHNSEYAYIYRVTLPRDVWPSLFLTLYFWKTIFLRY